MKLKIDSKELQSILSGCANIVDRKATMPILANILITAKANQLTLSATDLEVTAMVSGDAQIQEQGSITVNAKILSDIIRELPEGNVSLELKEGSRLEIIAGGSKMKIVGFSADEYPTLPGMGINASNKVSATKFLDMINKTLYAVSDDETSFNLTGVFLCSVDKQLRMVATDGHRIAVVNRDVEGLKLGEGVIIPKKGLSEIKKYLNDLADAEVGLAIKDGFLILNTNNAKFSVRLIDADYPDYQQVVPKSAESEATVHCQELSRALRRVSLLSVDRMKGVKLKFTKNKLEIKSSSPELGEAFEELTIVYSGDPVEVGFNANYIQDIITSLSDYENLNVYLNGSLGPGKFMADSDPDCYSVVMPMRIA